MGSRVSKVDPEVSNTVGQLFVVATPIGNLDDITLRAIEVLRRVDRILAEDTRHSRRLLDRFGIRCPVLALHEHNEHEATERLLGRLLAGETLALISDAGTPLISDPGFPLIRACREHGVGVVPVPGASALVAALSVAGLPTDRFRFEGFPPRRQQARIAAFEALRRESATLVFYESAHRIVDTLADMQTVFGAARACVVARELTKLHETVRRAPLGEMLGWVTGDADQRRGEFVVLLAGAEDSADVADVDDLLRGLLDELPVRQASRIAARITGQKKNAIYRRALQLVGR
jgi:16S rRNA (cytidine1402-2'-O)-methyltransferase